MSRPRLVGLQYLVTAAAIALLPACVTAQDTSRVPTVTILKRIGGAVDGYPARGMVYVVLNANREVAAIVSSQREADSVQVRELRGLGQIHGPIHASPPPSQSLVMRCVYIKSALQGYCPVLPLRDIRTITLQIRMRDGTPHTIAVPLDADAIFLTMSGFDKFAFPYYTRVEGVEGATALRQRMLLEGRLP